jgi:hypothetical protein
VTHSRGVYPQNALVQALAAARHLCGALNPRGDAVCVRTPGHGVTSMVVGGRRTYVDHNAMSDGSGEGW